LQSNLLNLSLLLPVFPVLGPRAKNDKYGGDPGLLS
jgi:hypothetical protein